MEAYLKSTNGLVIKDHCHPPGTDVLHSTAPNFGAAEGDAATFHVYTVDGTEYREGDDLTDILPAWLRAYIKKDVPKAWHTFNDLREAAKHFDKVQKEAAQEFDSLKRHFRASADEGNPIESTDWNLYVATLCIGTRPLRRAQLSLQLQEAKLDTVLERWKLDFLRWFGAALPAAVELSSAKDYRFYVTSPPLTADETEVREDMLKHDVKFAFPQQWAVLAETQAHMKDAVRRQMGGQKFAQMTGGQKTTPSGLIVPD